MQKEPLSLFHEQLLLFLQNQLHEKKKSEGWDEKLDPEVRSYRDLLSHSIRGQEPLRLQEIVEKYRYLFEKRGPVHLEHKILEAFPEVEMKRLGFSPLRMIRGLPRLFCRKSPILSSKIHPAFSHLPTLKRLVLEKPLYSMYASQPIPKDAKVAIFANPGPDTRLAEEMKHQLKQAFDFLDVRLAAEVEKKELRGFDLFLMVSREDAALRQILALEDPRPLPKVEGFGRERMGLHFLDRGIFLRAFPPLVARENTSKEKRVFFSSLASQIGIFVYLHALFKSLELDSKEIELCVSEEKLFIEYIQSRRQRNLSILEKSFGIGRIDLLFSSKTESIEISQRGKTVRIVSLDSEPDQLVFSSEDFVGISGIDGFSDAISAGKVFFYDPATMNHSMVKNLIALAENRIAMHRGTVNILRLYTKIYEQQYREEGGEWVDEISIQCEEKIPLLEIAEKIGILLQDPDALVGFKKLSRLIVKEHSCNAFLEHMVQRAVCHRRRPEVERLEKEAVSKFIQNEIPISHLVQHMQDAFKS